MSLAVRERGSKMFALLDGLSKIAYGRGEAYERLAELAYSESAEFSKLRDECKVLFEDAQDRYEEDILVTQSSVESDSKEETRWDLFLALSSANSEAGKAGVSSAEYADKLGVSLPTALSEIAKWIKQGRVRKSGETRAVRYFVVK